MKISRYGHACVLVELADIRILIDPGTFSPDAPFALTDLDAIVVTHQHVDHVDASRLPTLLAGNPGAVLLADPETASSLEHGTWTPNADGLSTALGSVTMTGVGSRHAVILPELPRVANVGVLIEAEGSPRMFHPGDTYEYAPADIDVLALPLSAPWGKVSETVEFARRVSPSVVLPIHDCTIAEAAYGLYWGQVEAHSGVADARRLGQLDETEVVGPRA